MDAGELRIKYGGDQRALILRAAEQAEREAHITHRAAKQNLDTATAALAAAEAMLATARELVAKGAVKP